MTKLARIGLPPPAQTIRRGAHARGAKYLGLEFAMRKLAEPAETKYTKVVKEEEDKAKNSDQEARDRQRGERFRKEDEDCGVGASHQGPEEDKQRRRLGASGRRIYLGF